MIKDEDEDEDEYEDEDEGEENYISTQAASCVLMTLLKVNLDVVHIILCMYNLHKASKLNSFRLQKSDI